MTMNKNSRLVLLALIAAVLVIALVYAWIDHDRTKQVKIDCGATEGIRYQIDMNTFATKYTGYTISIEGEIKDKGKLSAKLGETQYQQLSESLQRQNAFVKSLVGGFNGCGVSQKDYNKAILNYEKVDDVARQIDEYLKKDRLSANESAQLGELVHRYTALTNQGN
jgi:hypothetical protein